MGLAIEVGLLAYLGEQDEEGAEHLREDLIQVNRLLTKNKLSEHLEPESLPKLVNRCKLMSFPYSYLHHLRRFAAYASSKENWKPKPFPKSSDPANDPMVEDASMMFESHLLCHSDCEGYYVPIDFAEPIFAGKSAKLPGGILGSSQGLMRELLSIAPLLKIKLVKDELRAAEAARLNKLAADVLFEIEHRVWFALFEAARLSILHRAAIVFC